MEIQRKRVIRVCFGLITSLAITVTAFGQPNVPGFDVTKYADVPEPDTLAFSPSGELYVNPVRNFTRIYRIGPGGSPVEQYGDTDLGDSGFRGIAYDASGAIAGVADSVLVGDGSDLVAILPDQTTVPLLSISEPDNIISMSFDRTTRLLMSSSGTTAGFSMWVTTGDTPVPCGNGFAGITVDGANRIYYGFVSGQVAVKAPDCTQLPDLVQAGDVGIFNVAFGPYDGVWEGDLFASTRSSVYRIKPDGAIALFGTGFDNAHDIAFGPDSALYVADRGADAIYRITPNGVQTLTISIDIKPGSNKNPVNPKSKGKLKVAIITTDEFDASTVDADSVLFGPGEAKPVWYRLDDVDHDGDLDLALKFNIKETGIACGDTEATLIGETFDGVQITGTDFIKTVGCEPKKCNKKKHHYKHRDDDCDDNDERHGKHKEEEHHKRHYSKHHDDDRDDDHKKR